METFLLVTLLGAGRFAAPPPAPPPPASLLHLPATLGVSAEIRFAPVKDTVSLARLELSSMRRLDRTGNVVVGGVIGAVTGIVACTVISNIANDPGTGFSTCTETGYLAFGLGGFAVGALVGAAIK